jgi:hypothetical protein
MKVKGPVKQWDLLTYKLGAKIETGVVLQCFDGGDVRVDTDGVIERSRFISVERGKGRDVIYAGKEYKEYESYRVWLRDHYDLPVKEV